MLLIEFPVNLTSGLNLIKYVECDSSEWYYLYIDIETLSLLISNYGCISTCQIPTQPINCDNMTTGKEIHANYCGAEIILECNKNTPINLSLLLN